MAYAIRVEDESYVWVVGRHVDEGQSVVFGSPLIDIMTPDGIVETIKAKGAGVIGFVLGNKLRRAKFSDIVIPPQDLRADGESDMIRFCGSMGSVFPKGNILCNVVPRMDRGQKGADLRPRPQGMAFKIRNGRVAAPK